MNYKQTMEYVEEIGKYGSVLGLANMKALCARIGNPQNDLKIIHIAGTNGKGSLLAYLSSILQEAGYVTGRYISPVIFDYREKIQINQRYITKKALCQGMEILKEAAEQMVEEGLPHPTIFEMETALAFWYFSYRGCEVVVLESGLGGLLDATNVIDNPIATVFASISMDHMQFLGNTIEKIAEDKAGIIKKNSIVVSMMQKQVVQQILSKVAKENDCYFSSLEETSITGIKYGIKKQVFSYGAYKNLIITMAGKHQIHNAALAVRVVDSLRDKEIVVSEKALRDGLQKTEWKGRFSVINEKPLVIVDGAHNEDAALKLADSIRFYFTNRKIIYIMGVLRDKEYNKMLCATASLAQQIITITPPDNSRALHAYELAEAARVYHQSVTAADSIEEGVELAFLLGDKDTIIVAFGSLTFLGKLTEIVDNRDKIGRDLHGK